MQRYENFNELVSRIPDRYFETHVNIEAYMNKLEGKYTKLQATHKQELELAERDIKNISEKDREEVKNKSDTKGNQKSSERNNTPVFQEYSSEYWTRIPLLNNEMIKEKIDEFKKSDNTNLDVKSSNTLRSHFRDMENREIAIITIQRLLRGRMSQNVMFDEKEKRLALIKELLVVSDIK